MRKKFAIIAIITLCFTNLYSQKGGFAKGYYIDNKNNKIECLIKDEDWDYSPTQFVCKADENSEAKVISINDFQEFSVDEYKYIKTKVKIDKSNDNFDKATSVKALDLVEENLLIRVLVEGDANLYSYKNENILRFFYRLDNSILPLSYKIYYDDDNKGYRKNETYKQELLNALKCDKITQGDIVALEYKTEKLSTLFIKYNVCRGGSVIEHKAKKNINTFDLYGKVGFGQSSFTFDDGNNRNFGNKAKVIVAFEAEINLSNKAKNWSILVEPSYQYYKNSYNTGASSINIDYKSIDFSLGLRKYMILNSKSFLFVNAYYTYGFTIGSSFGYSNSSGLDITKTLNPSLGLGILYNKKYSMEARYQFARNLFNNYTYQSSNYSTIGVTVGYKFL